ncbi:MAG: hypothetical protein ACON39_02540 [Coraliomargaritaceae bacterium]
MSLFSAPGCILTEKIPSPTLSYLPSSSLEWFVYEQLDLASFRNSLGPSREKAMRHFSDFGIFPTTIRKNYLEMETEDWFYGITILERRDRNGDGIEDLLVDFVDAAKMGTYRSSHRYLLTRYSDEGQLLAIAFEMVDRE